MGDWELELNTEPDNGLLAEEQDEHFYAIISLLAECYKLIVMFIVAKL